MIKNIEKEVEKITKWIKDYIESSHANGVVVGNSGGKDCATVIGLAQRALGKEKVITIAMPCNSIKEDVEDAKLVANTFEVPIWEVDLTDTYQTLENEIGKVVKSKDEWREREARINTKPRLRMTTLYYIAQSLNYLVIGTRK